MDLFEEDLENLDIDPSGLEAGETSFGPRGGTGNFRHTDLSPRYRFGGANPAPAGQQQGVFKRWREYRKQIREKQPLVRWGKLFGLWKPLAYRGVSQVLEKISVPAEQRGNFFVDLYGGIVDGYKTSFKKQADIKPADIVPGLRRELEFAGGSTKIEKVYFYRYNGQDVPIFFSTGDNPSEQQLREGIAHVQQIKQAGRKRYRESKYNKMDKAVADSFLDGDFITWAADKFTRGDYKRYFEQEPGKAHRWFVKLDTAWIHQYGDQDAVAEAALPNDLKPTVFVRKVPENQHGVNSFWNYVGKLVGKEKPFSWGRYAYWKAGDIIVDLVDLAFGDHVLESAEALKFPADSIRDLSYSFLKIGSDAMRGFFNPRTPYLAYEQVL